MKFYNAWEDALVELRPGHDFVPCTELHAAMGSGRYGAAEGVLRREGWNYSISMDGWVAPGLLHCLTAQIGASNPALEAVNGRLA